MSLSDRITNQVFLVTLACFRFKWWSWRNVTFLYFTTKGCCIVEGVL